MYWLLLVLRSAVALFAGVVVAALTWIISQELPLVVRLTVAAATSVAVWVTGARADGEALRREREERQKQGELPAHEQER